MLGRKAADVEIVPSGQALNMVSDLARIHFVCALRKSLTHVEQTDHHVSLPKQDPGCVTANTA